MRVIGGTAKGRRLKMVPGSQTRPIPDRVKEALFNILGRDVEEACFLDLFAGTGSVGIEALSRGADQVVFVEIHRIAVKTIDENLQDIGLQSSAKVIHADVFSWLDHPGMDRFDFVYVAPPQYHGLWLKTLTLLDQNPEWLNPDAWVIVQIDPKENQAIALENLQEIDRRKYGRTMLIFYEAIQADYQ